MAVTRETWLHQWLAAADAGDLDAFDELLHPDVVVHAPMDLSTAGIEAEKRVWRDANVAMPDLRHDVQDTWETPEGIAARVRVSGTHQGSFGGIEATGCAFEIDQAMFVHLRDGRAVEIWEIVDTASLLRQLGQLPDAPPLSGATAAVSLRELDDANREAVEALRVSPDQERYVGGVAAALREAGEHPGARPLYWAVYADDTPVGFVMIADEVDGPDYMPHYLWKLLIDERHQRRGFGTAALDLVVEYFRGRPGVEVLNTSVVQGEGSPLTFYERYGFERAGGTDGEEVPLRLRLN